MNESTEWREATRLVKRRIQGAATVITWWTSYLALSALADRELVSFFESNQWLAAIAVLLWLAIGAAVGHAAARAVFKGLPDPDTA